MTRKFLLCLLVYSRHRILIRDDLLHGVQLKAVRKTYLFYDTAGVVCWSVAEHDKQKMQGIWQPFTSTPDEYIREQSSILLSRALFSLPDWNHTLVSINFNGQQDELGIGSSAVFTGPLTSCYNIFFCCTSALDQNHSDFRKGEPSYHTQSPHRIFPNKVSGNAREITGSLSMGP